MLQEAELSAAVTHRHPDSIKGAQAIASAIFWARTGQGKDYIKSHIETMFGYDLSLPLDQIRPGYRFDKSCPGSVPQALTAFLESGNYEDAIRNAVSIGGESTAIACMAGGIAQAYYKNMPEHIKINVRKILRPALLRVSEAFDAKYGY